MQSRAASASRLRWPSFLRRPAQPAAPAKLPAIPDGERVYAIGDVHGCADEFERLIEAIAEDHRKRGPAKQTVILLGDLMNRGADSARVIAQAQALVASGVGRLIKGNHEEIFVLASRGDHRAARVLMSNGGEATLMSFGMTQAEIESGNHHELAERIKQAIPRDVVAFLDAAEDKIAIGDYLFVHAGIRPGVPIAEQASADLRWIRHEFLNSQSAHGAMVVHGHSITETVAECENRIGIDTGAYLSGTLTAIGLEQDRRWFLST